MTFLFSQIFPNCMLFLVVDIHTGSRTNNVRAAPRREAWGRLPTLLPMWPTSTLASSFEALRRAHPWDPTLSGQQAAPTFHTMPSCLVGRFSSYFPPNLLREHRYGALHITTKKLWDDTADSLHRQHRCLGMELTVTRTSSAPDNMTAAETCATITRRTLRILAPPSPSPSNERKPALPTGAMDHAIATKWRISGQGGRGSRCWSVPLSPARPNHIDMGPVWLDGGQTGDTSSEHRTSK